LLTRIDRTLADRAGIRKDGCISDPSGENLRTMNLIVRASGQRCLASLLHMSPEMADEPPFPIRFARPFETRVWPALAGAGK
jgi:proline racemase